MTASTPNPHRPVSHTNNFDAIRIVAALAVLVSHHHALTGQFEPLVLGIHTLGGFAVLAFFVLSGYLVTASWHNDPHLLRFSLRRALRLWPALIAVILLTTYVMGTSLTTLPPSEYLRSPLTREYLSNIWLENKGWLPGVFEKNIYPRAINGSLWTISFEVQCYMILACAGVLGALRSRAFWVLAVLATFIWYQSKYGPDFHADWKVKREMMVYFLLGSAMFMLQPLWSKRPLMTAIILVCVGMAIWKFGYRYLGFTIAVPYLLIYLGSLSTPVIRSFGRWGDPSYGIYLIAFPTQQAVLQWLWPTGGLMGTMLLSIAITTSLAYLSWHTVEKGAMNFRPRKP
ncbi:acyltransferase family protein [Delftia tsuruhatensis]|uniref:acyltransferase family protein n=1 Tax=Delftia tsuruhatensis TaxID=180282 RepID=UPI0028A5A810|nr:acyltransferase [Delftia tsuruhatensis]